MPGEVRLVVRHVSCQMNVPALLITKNWLRRLAQLGHGYHPRN